jgi:hypothetical protein
MELKVLTTKEEKPSLKEAQDFVGGLVELVNLPNGDQMLVNEEGIMKELPINEPASSALDQPVLGNAIILAGEARWD